MCRQDQFCNLLFLLKEKGRGKGQPSGGEGEGKNKTLNNGKELHTGAGGLKGWYGGQEVLHPFIML